MGSSRSANSGAGGSVLRPVAGMESRSFDVEIVDVLDVEVLVSELVVRLVEAPSVTVVADVNRCPAGDAGRQAPSHAGPTSRSARAGRPGSGCHA